MSNTFEEKVNIVKKYLPRCNSVYSCYTYGNIPRDKFNNACSSYAGHMEYGQCIGLIDETVFGSGKKGMLFGIDGFYADSHNGIMLYADGIKWNSLGSSYNLTAMNEMLEKLYEVATRPSGWEIAGSLLKGAWNWYQENSDLFEVDENESSNSAIEADDAEEADDESQEMLQLFHDCVEYIKKLQVCVSDALEGDADERLEALAEMVDIFDDDTVVLEGEELTYEGMIDGIIQSLMEDSEIEDIDEINASEKTTEFHEKLSKLLKEGDIENIDEQLCELLQQYQKTLRKMRKTMKRVLELPWG